MSSWADAEGAVRRALGLDVFLAPGLAAAAARAGMDAPEPFRPPHPHLSLSHADGMVVAGALGAGDRSSVAGLGVDYEPARRAITERAARLFLDDLEQARVEALPEAERSRARLALWTVKEAAYKATPDNGGHTVAAYHVAGPVSQGVTRFRDSLDFLHVVVPLAEGLLAVAVLPEHSEVTCGAG